MLFIGHSSPESSWRVEYRGIARSLLYFIDVNKRQCKWGPIYNYANSSYSLSVQDIFYKGFPESMDVICSEHYMYFNTLLFIVHMAGHFIKMASIFCINASMLYGSHSAFEII